MKPDPAKKYIVSNSYSGARTPVRVLCNDAPGDYPVVVIDKHGGTFKLTADGFLRECDKTDGRDPYLRETTGRVIRSAWLNVYPVRPMDIHDDRHDAELAACIDRVACIKIEINCEEGEGLS